MNLKRLISTICITAVAALVVFRAPWKTVPFGNLGEKVEFAPLYEAPFPRQKVRYMWELAIAQAAVVGLMALGLRSIAPAANQKRQDAGGPT